MYQLRAKLFAICLVGSLIIAPGEVWGQDQLVLRSPLISAPDTVWVFTPSGYNKDQLSYPVVYLLNGYAGSYHQWNDVISVQKLANRFGFVIVCPDGLYDSWYLNSPIEEHHQYRSFFFNVLITKIGKRYRINEEQRFISGLSMGGYGALHLFLQRPDMFLSAGSTSGVVNLAAAATHRQDKYFGLHNLFGLGALLGKWPAHRERWKQYSLVNHLKTIKKSGKKIIFDVGRDDPFFEMNKAMAKKADSLGIDVTFITRPGGHSYQYWKSRFPIIFSFLGKY